MHVIADLHLHSRFSRAVSPQMTIVGIAEWARKKGIGLVATGDWTHPIWMREIGEKLEEDGSGLLRLKSTNLQINKSANEKNQTNPTNLTNRNAPLFLLSTEISCIYSQGGKTRRVHTLVWVPTLASAQKISQELTKRGCNLLSDGRPIIGLSLIHLAELVLTVEPHALIVPAHVWTPWFSVYGKMGGFESLEEAFGQYEKQIYAVETGLSSSPDMNWRIKELDNRSIVSFSDAHSGPKLGREATVFEIPEITYENIEKPLRAPTYAEVANENLPARLDSAKRAGKAGLDSSQDVAEVARSNSRVLRSPPMGGAPSAKNSNLSALPATGSESKISYTIEFYPEEGKYHYTGHRDCNIRLTPEEVVAKGTTCSVCGKPLTQGVMQRVEELADPTRLSNGTIKQLNNDDAMYGLDKNIRLLESTIAPSRPPFVMLVPLQEIIAEAIGAPVASPKTLNYYQMLTSHFQGEFAVLLDTPVDEIAKVSTPHIADGVRKVRAGDIVIDPGYDGVFGVVKIWKSDEEKSLVDKSKEQLGLF